MSGRALAHSATKTAATAYTRGQTLYTYKNLISIVSTIDWSPDGRRILTSGAGIGDYTNCATIWDALTGDNVVFFHTGSAYNVLTGRWSPDGTLTAFGVSNQGIVWNPTTNQTISTYSGHASQVLFTHVEWSPDGQHIASAGEPTKMPDYTVQIWDPTTGTNQLTYRCTESRQRQYYGNWQHHRDH